jgi:hypothetical protein
MNFCILTLNLNDNMELYRSPLSNCTDITCRHRERQNPLYDLTYEFCVEA